MAYVDSSSSESDDDYEESEQNELDVLEEEIKRGEWNIERPKNEQKAKDTKGPETKETEEVKEAIELKKRFFETHEGTVVSTHRKGYNIFHILAVEVKDKQVRKLKSFVHWVVEIGGHMLAETDQEGRTAFHSAIQTKNYRMLQYMLAAHERFQNNKDGSRKWDLDKILEIRSPNQNGNTVVHLAIENMTPYAPGDSERSNVVNKLVEKASVDTLRMQNNWGLTPLHLAVEGKRCNAQQVGIVKKLIERCEEALDIYEYEGKHMPSVYLHHQETYKRWKETALKHVDQQKFSHVDSPEQEPEKPRALWDKDMATEELAEGEEDEEAMGSGGGSDAESLRKPSHDKSPSLDHKPASDRISNGDSRNIKKLQRRPTIKTRTKERETSQQPSRKQQKQSMTPSAASTNGEVTEASVREIARYLKHTYLRTSSRQNASHFLYSDVPENWKQIDFNLEGKEGEIDEADFKAGYRCANLEDTLKSVHIPHLIIKPKPRSPPVGEQTDDYTTGPSNSAVGRTDLGIIFRWLRDEAKVDKIIKLIVDDSHHPPHSDEQIETSVKPFDVEVWDWRKIDLCCETIAEAAFNAREVNLYWSGNNAVLRGWSDPQGGLARLPYLRKVTVFPQSGIEGSTRNERNFNNFKERLNRCAKRPSGKDIEVTLHNSRSQPKAGHARERVKNDNALQNHRWLKCMDDFKNFIVNAPIRKDWRLEPIKIAVIDDGIDTTKKELQDRIVGGQCFSADESSSFYVSAGGHGTMMARLIARVFPRAKILSLKLDEHPQSDGKSQFSVHSAANAITWAAKCGVSIINMSWSIEKTGGKHDGFDHLESAVRAADAAKILMFCSNNDQGETKDNSYPGRRNGVFKIGAATAMGGKYHYVSAENVDFLFPGRVVEKEQDEDAADNTGAGPKNRSTEGSSLATAFASGLAGLVLYILQLTSVHYRVRREDDKAELYTRVTEDPDIMKKIFKKLATPGGFVEVWTVFQGADDTVRARGRSEETKFKILDNICTLLTSGI